MGVLFQHLVAKTGDHEGEWLPLHIHLKDTASVTEYLISHFLADSIGDYADLSSDLFQKTAVFLAAVHDIGKATVLFQTRITSNLPQCRSRLIADDVSVPLFVAPSATPHSLAGEVILESFGCIDSVAEIVGAHHGSPSDKMEVYCQAEEHAYPENYYGNKASEQLWSSVWTEIIAYALQLSGFSDLSELPRLSVQMQMLFTGILITADWLASNTAYFPLLPDESVADDIDMEQRINEALRRIAFPERWNSRHFFFSQGLFRQSFSFLPNVVQTDFLRIVSECEKPGLFILEAPMGCGKTEAALMGADILAARTERSGVFFGLPSQATANGIFPRIMQWAELQSETEYYSIRLVHGASAQNSLFAAMRKGIPEHAFSDDQDDSGLIAHSWFAGSKQACLDQFGIGTVDRLLMMALKRRLLILLLLGLSQKVVVIDECHAYDTYMNQYLEQALRWLGSYGTPVILLSATLPAKRRAALAAAYLQSKQLDPDVSEAMAYPLLTWTDGNTVQMQALPAGNLHQNTVDISFLPEQDLPGVISDAVEAGGCIGIILNTVRRAQAVTEMLKDLCSDAEIILCHAQFVQSNRADIEEEILRKAGKKSDTEERRKTIIIGTQVLEQSLDIDFDLLITDICPMDLLLQRIGRLHRHTGRERPEAFRNAVCRILGSETEFDSGSVRVYGEWLLRQTVKNLPHRISIPADISPLVQAVYNFADCDDPAYQEYQRIQKDKKNSAKAFLLGKPNSAVFSGLLDRTAAGSETEAEASVRDGVSSVEVLVMMRAADGMLRFLPHQKEQHTLDPQILPGDDTCRTIAEQRLRLPALFSPHTRG